MTHRLSTGLEPPCPIGLARLAKMAFDGEDLSPLWNALVERFNRDAADAAALLDLSEIAHLQGRPADRAALQELALQRQRVFRHMPGDAAASPLRLLAFMAPGDFMANMPVEFLLQNAHIVLDMVYVSPGDELPEVPDHDIAFVAVAESDANQATLQWLARLIETWPRPVLNHPGRIAPLTRDGAWELLRSIPGVAYPINAPATRDDLAGLAAESCDVGRLLAGAEFPIIARPRDSHAGEGLAKLDDSAALAAYLSGRPEDKFYIAPFVDYRSADGLFRKYRLVLIEGVAYVCHMAVSDHWMVHYLNADMKESAARRSEEARFMAEFDSGFAARHGAALEAVANCIGLDYVPFDCAETPDGRLLIFEIGTNMIVHAMDPPDLFPYKTAQMGRIFEAFAVMLARRAGRNLRTAA
jgi:hypothetical protein